MEIVAGTTGFTFDTAAGQKAVVVSPAQEGLSPAAKWTAGVFMLLFLSCAGIVVYGIANPPTKEEMDLNSFVGQKAQARGQEPNKDMSGLAYLIKNHIRDTAKNPKSIEFISNSELLEHWSGYGWQQSVTYRGENSFGAMNIEQRTLCISNDRIVDCSLLEVMGDVSEQELPKLEADAKRSREELEAKQK
jgi:hypothetical protein